MLGDSIRHIILEQSKRAHVGHIGSALSIADMIGAVYDVIGLHDPADPDRDRFVLSKGHAALALYAALSQVGTISESDLATFCADDSFLGVHPEHLLPGVDFSTGSLGQGLSMGVGSALAAAIQHSSRRTIVLVSDAECQEGAIWEAAMFAGHHGLDNLTVLIDHNHQQAFGYTADVLSSESMVERWTAFGWDVHQVDGHDEQGISSLISSKPSGKPRAIVAETVFGKGVSFMEGLIRWHYLPMTDAEYEQAVKEVEALR